MIRFGMALMEMVKQLTKGFVKATGRQPDNLEKLKIQQEAVKRFKDMNKVVDMEGNVIDTSKGIMGGKQIQDSPEFGKKIRETYDAAKGPGKGQEMVDALKSPGAQRTKSIMEDNLGMKLYGDETFEEILEIQRTGKHPRGEPSAKSLKEELMKTDNPYSDLVKTTEKGPKSLEQRRKEAEEALKNKNVVPFKDPKDMAQGGRAGFSNGSGGLLELLNMTPKERKRVGMKQLADKIGQFVNIEASGSKTGKQQIQGAPEGITSDSESVNAIIKADIPISQKINLLADLQYGKGRTRIEKDDQEIFLDEGGFKSKNVGLGFNKDGEGISGSIMRNLETGDDDFKIRFLKRFAEGGRISLKDGMDRRTFMKIMGGLATLPIVGKLAKGAKLAAPAAKKVAEITAPALDKIIETVMSAGKLVSQSGRRLKELTTKKKLKDVEVEEDMMDGPSYTIKTKDKTIYYKPGRQDEMGFDDDIIEVIEDTVTKKASGGVARMLGE